MAVLRPHLRKERPYEGAGDDPNERVFGIFALRYDYDGEPYYAPTDPEMQPGVAAEWFPFPGRALILSWEPVDMARLLDSFENAWKGLDK